MKKEKQKFYEEAVLRRELRDRMTYFGRLVQIMTVLKLVYADFEDKRAAFYLKRA
jgi:hypothetical protein